MVHSSSIFSRSARRPVVARTRSRGFTLLEILLALAIIALLAGVLVGGSARLLSEQPATAHEIFWKAVQQARKTALLAEHDIRLKFDKDKKQFLIIDGIAPKKIADDGFTKEDAPLKTLQVPPGTADDLTIEFLPSGAKSGSAILVGGVLIESQPIPYVTFYADGTCSAFRAQFIRPSGAHILSIDPWTCAPMLTPSDPNSLPFP